jgi:4-amino-4-deoxy-L-arabinose transferase-like glycosyltransferase
MVLAIIVGGLLAKRMFGAKIALGGVVMLALAPLLLRYGFEIRMYADASLIGVAATYALYAAWLAKGRAKATWLVGYGLLVAAGTYLLYYLAFLWIAHVVWLLYVRSKRRMPWKALLPYLASYAAAVVLFLPWLRTFVSQISNGALAPIGQPLNLDQLIGIVTFNFVYQPLYMVTVPLTAMVVALVGVFVWAIPKAKQALKGKGDEVALLSMYMGVPVALLMIVSLARSMYTERYLSHVAIGFMLLAGTVVAAAVQQAIRQNRRAIVAPVIVAVVAATGVVTLALVGNFNCVYWFPGNFF